MTFTGKNEHAILFSAPMIVAIRADRKTQTRRVVRELRCLDPDRDDDDRETLRLWGEEKYGATGDRLWVRETFANSRGDDSMPTYYRADQNPDHFQKEWKPSIFMPRWASRITLEVTGVRVERLQDISKEDVLAEGVEMRGSSLAEDSQMLVSDYASLWDRINGKKHPWSTNPWVWAITFKKVNNDDTTN